MESTLHELFERQAKENPERIACVGTVHGNWQEEHSAPAGTSSGHNYSQVTFEQLNAVSNGLAAQLREKGVGPGVTAAVFVDRSIDMIVALLAILKAGGAYIPIDPKYPAGRLEFILKDSASPVLVTLRQLKGTISDVPGR